MHRFFLPKTAFQENIVSITDPDALHQLTRVLRVQPGFSLICLDNTDMEYETRIREIAPKKIIGDILSCRKNQAEVQLSISLFQALPKQFAKFEFILQKGTEIGITSFHPILTARTECDGISPSKHIRFCRILQEAAEQSGRGIIPTLAQPKQFTDAISALSNPAFLAYECSKNPFPLAAMKSHNALALFIGPEGGFTEQEINMAKEKNIAIFGLGPRILRTETAALVIGSALIYS